MVKIGVFDSGVGGLSFARAISKALPDLEVILREDKENLPYGTKTTEELLSLVSPIFEEMARAGCDVIVVACNTVTTNIIEDLRKRIDIPLVGVEPMLKPASVMTKSGVIAVLATPKTLSSKRYQWLKKEYCYNVAVLEPDCSNWAQLIEGNSLSQEAIKHTIEEVLERGADVIVLGCTHYHWIREDILDMSKGKAIVIQPEEPVIKQLKKVIKTL